MLRHRSPIALTKRYKTAARGRTPSASTCSPARRSACSAATAPAKPRPSPCCWACSCPPAGRIHVLGHDMARRPVRRPRPGELLLALRGPAAPADGGREPARLLPSVQRPPGVERRIAELASRAGSGRLSQPPRRPAFGRPEDARGPGQIVDQPPRACCCWTNPPPAWTPTPGTWCAAGWSATARKVRLHHPARVPQHGRGGAAVRHRC